MGGFTAGLVGAIWANAGAVKKKAGTSAARNRAILHFESHVAGAIDFILDPS
jgi:hypothetical protein